VYLHSCPERVKAQAYTSLVRPVLEYGSSAWDPYRIYQNNWLEQVKGYFIQDRKDVFSKH